MKVGAVMPTYGEREYIAEAIASVWPQVDELVVVDDGGPGSIDALAALVPDGALLMGFTTNKGTAEAINAGAQALGLGDPDADDAPDWLTWVSDDNTYRPGAFRTLLDASEGAGAVYGGFLWYRPGQEGHHILESYKPLKAISSPNNCPFGPAFIIRRDVWEEAGPHRGRISHDYDHWLRVEEVCWKHGLDIVHVPEVLCDYRAHDKRVTVTRKHEFDAHHWQKEAMKRRANMDYAP